MPLDRAAIKNSKLLKSLDFAEWQKSVQDAAQLNGLSNLSVATDHHICPKNILLELCRKAVDASRDGYLISVGTYAVNNAVIAPTPDPQARMEALMERIIWACGNVIPGAENVMRVDDPKDGWEAEGALPKALVYANRLKDLLVQVITTPSHTNWQAVANHVDPQGPAMLKARKSILKWADAWATHPKYRIYVRLTKAETEHCRRNFDSFSGSGAWIHPRHEILNQIAGRLANWEPMVLNSTGADQSIAYKAMCKDINQTCFNGQERCSDRWLEHHQPP
ncbi:hypothetical protein [Azospirillum brasilense]|uniref:Uncharacterized protein n=1 Tax=Azospirillum brasilense TaxID=192 RepID=A0A235HBU4_AZOBR|nr:hypothetical protein [Azospirillum brasilense]OYD82725.1 hypothetical protein CHT98_18825 [Azospirillum brasilense]